MLTGKIQNHVWHAALAGALGAVLMGGCAAARREQPHTRFGALPFPGVTSLFHAADPGRLSPHRYSGRAFFGDEGERGIVYTERAGFLDVVHVRDSADWAWYVYTLMQDARGERRKEVVFDFDGAGVRAAMPAEAADDAAVAARLAYALMTWHEAATWYGHSMVPLVSERRSAFTYDDTTSHFVGVNAAFCAMAGGATWETYDQKVGACIEESVASLEPRSPAGTVNACLDARGGWWENNSPILRDAAVHLSAPEKRPLVLDTRGHAVFSARLLALPPVSVPPEGAWFTLEVQPDVRDRVRSVLGGTTVRGVEDMERVVADVAADLAARGHAVVLHDGDDAAPVLPVRRTALGPALGSPLVAQFVPPVRPGGGRFDSTEQQEDGAQGR